MISEFNLSSQIAQFVISFGASALVLWFAKRKRFFSFPYGNEKPLSPPSLLHVIGAFGIYFFCGVIVSLALAYLFRFQNVEPSIGKVSWVSFLASAAILAFLLLYCKLIRRETCRSIWGRNCTGKDLLISAAAWVVSFPLVACVSQLLILFVYLVFHVYELPDQVAIKLMKLSFQQPLYFLINGISVVVFAPFVEEILFRGFLQSYLRRYFGVFPAIAIASILFAFLHYSAQQKLGNIPLLGSLFVFSCFLGFIYERQRSLFAPIFLHAIFNTLSVASLYFIESP
jgi:uncharacterized protein